MIVRAREVNVEIERLGGVILRQVGSHRRYAEDYALPDGTTGRAVTIVAQHPGDIPTGTLRKIERDLEPALGRRWLTR
ncbi:MAG: type II toxin-antitoxin system HicA family toxin [Actinomycetota bacterium]|nr:type II toxin-antitoxin system HicA family toxin [Actinomycetota bacterium]